jgi:drug/metabolite transporter (DMT)-like permease
MRPASSRVGLAAPIMVAVAAMLWGTDGIFRTALIAAMPANAIVLWEHILLTAATGWILWRDRATLSRFDRGDWVAAIVVAVGASALATVLFTGAFAYGNPVTVLLLQKTQPLIAISLAAVMLREPLPGRFWPLLPVALIGTYLITFGDGNPFAAIAAGPGSPVGAAMALGASVFWGAGTVLGRRLLAKIEFPTMTALRFTLALPALIVWAMIAGYATPGVAQLPPLLGTALLSGLIGLLLYYRGLRDTPAAVATLCELCFPITAVILSVVVLGASVGVMQVVGIALLWGSIAAMRHRPIPAGVNDEAAEATLVAPAAAG